MLSNKDFPPLPSQVQRKPRRTTKRPSRTGTRSTAAKHTHIASLNDLPDELIVEILNYLPGIDLEHFQLLTLASLSLTNRRLHRIVMDRLYAAYDSFFCTPYPFLRTLMTNTHLASHVKSLSFKYGLNVHAERPAYVPSISDKQVIKDSLKKLNMAKFDWKQWASDCNDRNVDQEQLYATMLLYTPNVTRLEIDDGASSDMAHRLPWWLVHFRHVVNGVDLGRVHRFDHLKSIRVDVQYLKLRHLAPLFRLRSMRKVTLIGLVEWAHTREDAQEDLRRVFPAQASLIDELHMETSFVHDDVLSVVTSCIKRLKVFRYWSSEDQFMVNGRNSDDYWGVSDQDGYQPYDETEASNDYHSLLKALDKHSQWLETFSWRDEVQVGGRYYFFDRPALRDFTKLAHLEIPMTSLASHSGPGDTNDYHAEKLAGSLPRSVESLTMHLISDRGFLKAALDSMASHLRECAPALQQVKVIYQDYTTAPSYDWKGFGKRLHDQGILFEFVQVEVEGEGSWAPYDRAPYASDDSDSSAYEESLYSD